MADLREIGYPQPIAPVRPGDRLQERRPPSKRPKREPEQDSKDEPDGQEDDGRPHVDDYA
ncbi:hypothetical protein [Thiohalobacter sp.]|uniref:hypothetical protein n=1 Tax=Thiohalobacter sp. TaxID=2025948 RepID=UPI002617A195|nr:hypothetical protein [Thiohalobacter sp.]